MRRRALALALTALVAMVALAAPAAAGRGTAAAGPAQAPEGSSDVTVRGPTDETPLPDGDIIPRPNSGAEPREAGDRGGALQLALLAGIVAGVGAIVGLVVRESRRARGRESAHGSPAAAASTPTGRSPAEDATRRPR